MKPLGLTACPLAPGQGFLDIQGPYLLSLGILSDSCSCLPMHSLWNSVSSGTRDSVYLFCPIHSRKQSSGREAEYSDKHGQYLIGHGG